jgi:DNA invertase Pin-like site-specific DNA recombinase
LVILIEDLQALGIGFVSLGEGIDCTTPAGKLQLHILAALAEFEKARIQERVRAGLARAKAQGVRGWDDLDARLILNGWPLWPDCPNVRLPGDSGFRVRRYSGC